MEVHNVDRGVTPSSTVILVEGGKQIEKGEDAAFAQEIQDLVDAGGVELSLELMAFSFLQLMVMRTPPSCFGTAIIGLEYGEV